MDSVRVYLLLVLLLICDIIQYSVSQECTLHDPKDESKGLLKNISLVLNHQTFSVEHDGFKYTISICSDISKEFPFSSAIKSKVADPKNVTVIGRSNNTHIIGSYEDELVVIIYESGDNYTGAGLCQNVSWKTSFILSCHSGANKLFFMAEDNAELCSTTLLLKTPVLCASAPPPGLSKGSVFCVLLLTGCLMYLTIGIAYRRVMTGAKGLEQIPHYQFWQELGNLQADGCNLVCRKGSGREDSWNRITSNFNDSADEPLLHP